MAANTPIPSPTQVFTVKHHTRWNHLANGAQWCTTGNQFKTHYQLLHPT